MDKQITSTGLLADGKGSKTHLLVASLDGGSGSKELLLSVQI